MSKRTPPVSVQDSYSYPFYRDRLDDPGLLDRAVVTEDGDLAVPVGGKRHGGYLGMNTKAEALRLARQLAARPDEFPDIRYYRGDGWRVEWGLHLDWRGDDAGHPENYIAAGCLFGYSDAAIAAYGRMRAMRNLGAEQ